MVRLSTDAVQTSDSEREPRHATVHHGTHQPGADPLDSGEFRLEAHHQAGFIGEVDERKVKNIAQLDETQCLAPGGHVGAATSVERVVHHDPHRIAIDTGEADDTCLAVVGCDLEERVTVNDVRDELARRKAPTWIARDDREQFGITSFRIVGWLCAWWEFVNA